MRRVDLSMLRGELRLFSALVLLAFVVCHMTGHILLLVSLDTAESGLALLMGPWRTLAGTGLLVAALAIHYLNALWSIYVRRSLRLTLWEGLQLGLGLSIPPTIMLHVAGTRIAELALDAVPGYNYVLLAQFAFTPWLGVLQAVGLLTVWVHASIGIHFWLRTKRWYPAWLPLFVIVGLLLPALSLAGFVAGGNQVARAAAADPAFVRAVIADANVDAGTAASIYRLTSIGLTAHVLLLMLPFAGRGLRAFVHRRRRPPRLTHASGRTAVILPGASVLEILRENRIPHASVCGGRGRCTTCRILVTHGLETLADPGPVEAKALGRIGATPGMRLACQIHPSADIAVRPLLPPDAMASDGRLRGGLEGSERPITVMFVDLRASTTLAEARLPYDVLFILNHFHRAMSDALAATDGHYSQFTGDGLMALYGLHEADAATSVRQALNGAREMSLRLEQLNARLSAELTAPLRIGIGIHVGDAIVGAIGPPRSQIISAIGDLVNTCARLEGLTKDYDCALVLSRSAADAAGLALPEETLHDVAVKGRVSTIQFYALKDIPALAS